MLTVIMCVVMLSIARMAAAYDVRLWCTKYLTVPNPASRLLISNTSLPFGIGKHAADRDGDRRKLTAVGLILYIFTILCILCCILNGLKLESVEELKRIELARDRMGIRAVESTEALNERIVFVCLCFEMAVYLINSSRAIVGEVRIDGGKVFVSVSIALFVALLLVACFLLGKSALNFWQKILDAQR